MPEIIPVTITAEFIVPVILPDPGDDLRTPAERARDAVVQGEAQARKRLDGTFIRDLSADWY